MVSVSLFLSDFLHYFMFEEFFQCGNQINIYLPAFSYSFRIIWGHYSFNMLEIYVVL